MLAVCEPDSPLGCEVRQGGFGEVVMPGNPAELAETLHRWSTQPALLSQMKARAIRRARMFHRDRVLGMYERELLVLSGQTAGRHARQRTRRSPRLPKLVPSEANLAFSEDQRE